MTEKLKEKKDDPVFIDRYQSLVLGEVERITSLLNELLQFAKPSEPKIIDVNPVEIISQIVNLIHSKCEKLKIVVVQNHKIKTFIPADFNILKQALLNLVLNALVSMPNGGS